MAAIARMATGFFGSIAILMGIVMFFVALTGHAMVKNVDAIDSIALESMREFVKDNREEMREYIKDEYDAEEEEIPSRGEIIVACENYDLLPEEGKDILTPEICSGIEEKTDEEVQNDLIDRYVDSNLDEIQEKGLPVEGAEEVKRAVLSKKAMFASRAALVASSIFIYFIGVLLTFVGANFKLWRGLYRILFKTTIDVAAFTFLYTYLKYLNPETLIDLMNRLASLNPDYKALIGGPPLFVKLQAKVILDWVAYATADVFMLSIYILVPSLVATIAVFILRKVLNKRKEKALAEKESGASEKKEAPSELNPEEEKKEEKPKDL
ncbi:MAG: hypothetical protein ABIB71_01320 [Candidatus Woesearchaeota archaeon]